uniref:XapX domain-containing protein n=1 Tax=Yersinia frederiksenii TaxID=29484 RepID=UPI001F4C4B2E|nr:XapX domain-containing protein [Yersinia frederiksenii]ULG19848.1 XapX domain protein [Yersinia frederiksenii]
METILATVAGLFVGIIFTLIKLPIPAPPYLPGVMGVVGVYLGSVIGSFLLTSLFR